MLTKSNAIRKVGKFVPSFSKPLVVRILSELQKCEITLRSRHVEINQAPILLLGNQKAGTSAIAALLGEMTGLSVSVDLVKEYLSTGESYQRLKQGRCSFSDFVERNRLDFSRDIIKEANLTTFYDELLQYFPDARFVFIVRDPRENIRSILNRLKLPGNLPALSSNQLRKIKKSWNLVIDGAWLGLEGSNYIEMLAARWNLMADIYRRNQQNMIAIRYEDFVKDKAGEIARLAEQLGLEPKHDIADKVDIQYQPKGDRGAVWEVFFGKNNLQRIERICDEQMRYFGYLRS